MKLLVALDQSDKAVAAIAAAERLAAMARGELLLLNVFNPWVDMGHVKAPTQEERLAHVTAEREAYLAEQARSVRSVPTRTRVEAQHRGEETDECIARVAREEGVDVVVVASKRASNVAGLLLGSVAQRVLHSSPSPVLVVRPE